MTRQEYEQKRNECWEEYCQQYGHTYGRIAFDFAFDRAYALGKLQASCRQVKEEISQEEIEKAAEDYVSFEKGGKCYPSYIVERACCRAFKDGANFALGKQEKNADIVISGWVCRDKEWDKDLFASDLYLSAEKPKRDEYCGAWTNMGAYMPLNTELFPDLTWDDDPIEVELIIKRKKK